MRSIKKDIFELPRYLCLKYFFLLFFIADPGYNIYLLLSCGIDYIIIIINYL